MASLSLGNLNKMFIRVVYIIKLMPVKMGVIVLRQKLTIFFSWNTVDYNFTDGYTESEMCAYHPL